MTGDGFGFLCWGLGGFFEITVKKTPNNLLDPLGQKVDYKHLAATVP